MTLDARRIERRIAKLVPKASGLRWTERGDMGYFHASLGGFDRCVSVILTQQAYFLMIRKDENDVVHEIVQGLARG